MKPILAAISIILILTTHGWGLDFLYHSDGPYKGKVVDLETREPIEGAVVAGVWGLEFGFTKGFCDAKEVLTDKKGEFILPKASCFDPSPFAGISEHIIVFKPGYLGYPPLGSSPEEREARWPGFKDQELFKDTKEYNIIKLGRPKTLLERQLTWNHACLFGIFDETYKKLPMLLKVTNQEEQTLESLGKKNR